MGKSNIYTDKELLQILQDLAAELGRLPTCREMDQDKTRPSVGTYTKRFGSWRGTLVQAGLLQSGEWRTLYTRDQLLTMLQDKATELGRAPLCREMDRDRTRPPSSTFSRHFGTWNKALRAAGLTPHKEWHDVHQALPS
jgi:hypothetical protein